MLKRSVKYYYQRISQKTKLMIIAVILILYPVLILGYLGYINYVDIMKDKAIGNSENNVRDLSGMLSERIQKLNLFSIQLFYDRTIYNAYNKHVSGVDDFTSYVGFQQYLQSVLISKNELDEILIRFSGPASKPFQVNRFYVENTESLSNIDDAYRYALVGHGRPVWYIAQKDGKVTGIYLAKIIYDLENFNKEIGILMFKINQSYLEEVFNYSPLHSNKYIRVYSDQGQVVFMNGTLPLETDPLQTILTATPGTKLKEITTPEDTVYLLYDTIKQVNWKLVIGISSNELLKEVRDISRLILSLCIATIPIVLLLINYFYIDFIKPMNLLMKRMRQVESGEIGIVIENNRGDEFGYVFKTFNKMSLHIKNLIDTVYKKQIVTKDAEIKALQAQINPHFLYNTLEAINWKAKINGVDEISEMVSAFSYIIEANLNRRNEKFIPLSREIQYINSYNYLIQMRFGEKIRFEMHADEEVLDLTIPKLIIQPLIENAIYHGLEMKKGGGTIQINFLKQENELLILVSDDGLGIEEVILAKLKEDLADEKFLNDEDSIMDSGKIGVLNVHRRIKLLYGEKYGLNIKSQSGIGTEVTIRLPIL